MNPQEIQQHSESIAKMIVTDLRDRHGLSQAWDSIDADIQQEIRETWTLMARAGLESALRIAANRSPAN